MPLNWTVLLPIELAPNRLLLKFETAIGFLFRAATVLILDLERDSRLKMGYLRRVQSLTFVWILIFSRIFR